MSAEVIAHVLRHLAHDERRQVDAALGEWEAGALAERMASFPPVYVLDGSDGPCAAGGMFPVGEGVWDAWAVVTPEARTPENLPRLTQLCIRAYTDRLAMGAERVDVYCLADRRGVRAWYEAMGLKHAQDLPAYGSNGEDFVRYEVR